MPRPRRVKIGAFRYEVRLDPKLSEVASVLGTCITDGALILIDGNLPDELEAETTLHEVLHGVWAQTGLRKRFNDEDEEYVIWQLSPLIFQFIRDNPKVVAWIQSAGR